MPFIDITPDPTLIHLTHDEILEQIYDFAESDEFFKELYDRTTFCRVSADNWFDTDFEPNAMEFVDLVMKYVAKHTNRILDFQEYSDIRTMWLEKYPKIFNDLKDKLIEEYKEDYED